MSSCWPWRHQIIFFLNWNFKVVQNIGIWPFKLKDLERQINLHQFWGQMLTLVAGKVTWRSTQVKDCCVCHQAMYAKAVEITWKHRDKFRDVRLRLGVFSHHRHTAGDYRKTFPRCWTSRPLHWVWHNLRRLHCWCSGGPILQQGSVNTQASVWAFCASGVQLFPVWRGTVLLRKFAHI